MEYKYKIELHSHTSPVSGCATITPRELVTEAKKKGYDVLVITNHFFLYDHKYAQYQRADDPVSFYLNDFYEAKKLGESLGVKVLLGAEYCLDRINDILIFGIDEEFLRKTVMLRDISLKDFYNSFHNNELLFIQAHPFRTENSPLPLMFLDGVETVNTQPEQTSNCEKAIEFADENNIEIKTIGADVHKLHHIGISALKTKVLPNDEKELVKILKSGDYIFEVNEKEPN